jgi:hypothetical protein
MAALAKGFEVRPVMPPRTERSLLVYMVDVLGLRSAALADIGDMLEVFSASAFPLRCVTALPCGGAVVF